MNKISLYIATLALGAAALTSCSDNWEEPPMIYPAFPAGFEANTTIAELKAAYWQNQDSYGTVITAPDNKEMWICGKIVSSTASGNIYKTLVVQDATGAITIGLDTTKIEELYPMGFEIAVNVTGMGIGRYNGLMQLGVNTTSGVNRISAAAFRPHAMLNMSQGLVAADTAVVTIAQMDEAAGSNEGKQKWQSRLVRINDVKFVEAGEDFSNGSTTSRHIQDADGNRMIVYNSSYADFAYDPMPYGTGDVVGILSCYRNSWQLLLIDKASCIDFDGQGAPDPDAPGVQPEGDGTAANPYNATAAIAIAKALDENGKVPAYVKGKVNEISDISTQYGNATYTITDGSATLSVFRGYYLNGDKFTAEDQLKVGDEVVITGDLVNYKGNTPQFTQGSRLVSINGQGGEPTQDDGTLLNENDDNGLNGWTITNDVVWKWKEYNGKYYLNGQLFGVTEVPTVDAYAISPKLTVDADASLSFMHAARFQDSGLRTECGIVIREAGSETWTALTIPAWPEAGSWTFAESGSISLAEFAGKTVEIAFKYGCKATDTWEIRNLSLVNAKVAQ